MKSPNFFIVGAPKAGTTALQTMLASHHDVYMCPIKEPHYFSKDFNPKQFAPDYKRSHPCDLLEYFQKQHLEKIHIAHVSRWDQYIQLYREAENQTVVGEASSGYLYSTVAAENIYNQSPNAKIIIILRDPIDRAYSHFTMDLASGRSSTSSFTEAVKKDFSNPIKAWGGKHLYVELGLYADQVERYLKIFPSKNVKIINYRDWISDNQKILNEISLFLSIEPDKCSNVGMVTNKSKIVRFKKLHYFITTTRIREIQRLLIPNSIRMKLKKVWYSSSPRKKLTVDMRKKLSVFFDQDQENLTHILRDYKQSPQHLSKRHNINMKVNDKTSS